MGNNKIHLLVVDDDNRIRDLLKEYLTEKNYIVSTSDNDENAKVVKLFVCESCGGEIRLKHSMDDSYCKVSSCPCYGEHLQDELEDEVEWEH